MSAHLSVRLFCLSDVIEAVAFSTQAHGVVVAENSRLKSQLKDSQNAVEETQRQIESLKQEMATIRQGTIDYVLNHMAQFSKTKSTEV